MSKRPTRPDSARWAWSWRDYERRFGDRPDAPWLTVTVRLSEEDMARLAAMAAEAGTTSAKLAASIVREVLADDLAAHGEAAR
ncbi:hypothetical protein HW532_18965 [Kaustia mangrovi]|uniref:CopG family transcriptional regulator n=1 Tax=Kaustia mangrovi TaxID=2593653 RepID=A0A7S8C7G2_9HYPH|nr:hypothetical protein [Kaustia mangrovi]QPC44599.1 hypothetical protein HW532_18965 [Kaustia mangrovi]